MNNTTLDHQLNSFGITIDCDQRLKLIDLSCAIPAHKLMHLLLMFAFKKLSYF